MFTNIISNNKDEESKPILSKSALNLMYGSTSLLRKSEKNNSDDDLRVRLQVEDNNPKETKLHYPIAVIFVLFSKLFESFSANGLRTILALYLRNSWSLSESASINILHIFNFFGQFCPIFGAVIADSYLGNAKSIFYFMLLYSIGWFGMILQSFPYMDVHPAIQALLFISLFLVGVGNGSIRACITSLGGIQFKLPEQSQSLDRFFQQYYFLYYIGILLSKIIPPAVRSNTQCFGQRDCEEAVFGLLGGSFFISFGIFLCGYCLYVSENIVRSGNVLFKMSKCIWLGLWNKLRGNPLKVPRWIDASNDKFPAEFIEDVYKYSKILGLFAPLPIYWALLAQQDSTWTFQATSLDTTIIGGYSIQPDQAKAIGPIFLLCLMPIWQKLCIPLLNRFNIHIETFPSVAVGGCFAALAFICAGMLNVQIEYQIENKLEKLTIYWQIPQFFLLMIGEILLSIPGLQFSFVNAPQQLRSLVTATWLLLNAIGNLMVVALTALKPKSMEPSTESFGYAVLMCCGIFIFIGISYKYEEEQKKQQYQQHQQQGEYQQEQQHEQNDNRGMLVVVNVNEQYEQQGSMSSISLGSSSNGISGVLVKS